jgi:glycosyltransferase involved in cell wall biosynthesis
VSSIRLTVLDDGLFVRTPAGEVRPLAATFHRFVEAVARTGEFGRVRYVVPVRELRIWEVEPALEPVDGAVLEIVPTTSYAGIADYLLRASWVAGRNWRPIERAVADSDLLWLRLPAPNGLLALAAARRHRVPYFGWLAGNVSDAVSELAAGGGPIITPNANLFASSISAAEVEQTRLALSPVRESGPWLLAWAGRMTGGKGLLELVEAVGHLVGDGRDVSLALIGDGPSRREVERAAARLPEGRVADYGYVGDRATYMGLLRAAHLFTLPSRAEGVPKVLVEAMAAGLPIVAADAGAMREVLAEGERGKLVAAADAGALAGAIGRLLDDPAERSALRERGLAWAADHTADAQAVRLLRWLREHFPALGWPA